jgi:hypothetical protein
VPAVGHPAQEHRLGRRGVTQFGGRGEHQLPVDDEDLVALIDPKQHRLYPSLPGGVDVGAQVVGAVGPDPGEQRDVAQSEAHAGQSTSAERT